MKTLDVIESVEQLDAALAVVGDLDAAKACANANLDQALAAVRDEHNRNFMCELDSGELIPIDEVRGQLVGQIEKYATKHRKELLTGDKKSVELNHGTIGWRKQKDKVEDIDLPEEEQAKGLLARCLKAVANVATTLTLKLGKVLLTDLVQVKVTWSKPDVLKAFNEGKLTAAQLKKQGLEVVRGEDQFHCEPKSEKRAV